MMPRDKITKRETTSKIASGFFLAKKPKTKTKKTVRSPGFFLHAKVNVYDGETPEHGVTPIAVRVTPTRSTLGVRCRKHDRPPAKKSTRYVVRSLA